MKEITRTFTDRGGNVDSQVIVAPDDRRFRVTIRRDGYVNQSFARVDAWTSDGWTVVLQEPGEAVHHLRAYVNGDPAREAERQAAIREIELRLIAVATEVTS